MEREIGDIFECNGVKLKVVEAVDSSYCIGCYFDKEKVTCCHPNVRDTIGLCGKTRRKDGKSIMFRVAE